VNARSGSSADPSGGKPSVRRRLALLLAPAAVPPQGRQAAAADDARAGQAAEPAAHDHGPCAALAGRTEPDPLEHADPAAVADSAAAENLLRCWARENDLPRPQDDVLRLPLQASGTELCTPVRHWSATGWHRFGRPRLHGAPADAPHVDAVTLAALLSREAAHVTRGTVPAREAAALVGRVADSVRRSAVFVAERRTAPEPLPEGDPFLDAEQALVLGHPVHPTPKSREGLADAESRAYSPELRGSFALHWMAAERPLVAADSAWYEAGRAVPAHTLLERLAGEPAADALPDDCLLLPLHPWQAGQLRHRADVARMLKAGLLHDLGPGGDAWYPTSSVRTVHRPGSAAMLKLSLGLRITNSRRENLRKELLRGLEVHRLLSGGLETAWHAAHPGFDVVRDPAWLGLNDPDGVPVPGFDTVLRQNPFGPNDDAVCVASLTSPRPWPGAPAHEMRSRLADLVHAQARRTGEPLGAVSARWFRRYLDAVVAPVLWLDAHAGIALEAHQQNTLVLLDAEGSPVGGRYRDNQGYYFRTSRREEIHGRLPGAGEASDSFVDDDVTDERFAYYLGINNVLGLIGAFGAQGLAEERALLDVLRLFLAKAAEPAGGPVSPLPAKLLRSPTLGCKANLLTRLHGMDELVGPVDTQSVYMALSNPLTL
jgi:siderophore synthetase component